jgi:CBS domain-containing protein
MAKKVSDVMTDKPETVEPSDSATDAAKKMKEADTGALLVTDDDELKGIVTDRDIVVKAVAEGKDPDDVDVEDICSTDPKTIEPDADVRDAVKKMREADVRRLPVVDDGKPVGVVSLGDLAIALDDDSALADIAGASPNN